MKSNGAGCTSPRGYASLYDFCTDYLKYSRTAAWRRIHAARCIERFPRVAELLLSGDLTLTAAAMISRILTAENAEEIISYVRGRSTRDVEMLVVRHRPEAMLRDRVRQVCVMVPDVNKNDSSRFSGAGKNLSEPIVNKSDKNRSVCERSLGIESSNGTPVSAPPVSGSAPAGTPPVYCSGAGAYNASDTPGCEPGTAEVERVLITQRYKIEFVADPGFMEKLARVRSFLSTKYPGGLSLGEVFEITMTDFLDRHSPEGRIERRNNRRERRQKKKALPGNRKRECPENKLSDRHKHLDRRKMERGVDARSREHVVPPGKENQRGAGQTAEDRRGTGRNPAKRSRHIPQEIRDEVFARDGGRCTFISDNGKRCNSDWNLEIDRIVPFAKGGDNSPENLRLLCAEHNHLAAERAYGKNHMDKFYGGT